MNTLYQDYYRTVAPLFNSIRLDRDIEIVATTQLIQRVVPPGAGAILDIGCGTGRYSSFLKQCSYDVVGVDLSPEQVQQATNVIPAVCASATDLPFEEGRFASCLMFLLLQQLNAEERRAAICEAYRVLKPGGIFMIKTRSHQDIQKCPWHLQDIFPSAMPVNLQRYPDVPFLLDDLEAAGFTVTDTIPMFSEQPVEVSDLLNSVRNKHNTTLALIPEKEFEAGCVKLEQVLAHTAVVRLPHYHTVITSSKGTGAS